MTLVQIEDLVPSSRMCVEDEGERDDKEIGGGWSRMIDREDVKEERGLRLFCTAKPGGVRPKQIMHAKP